MSISANLICLMGRPGAGKTTVGARIAKSLGIRHLSAGDIARELAKTDDETREALAQGQLAPREKMNDATYNVLKAFNNIGGTLVMDGYPRYLFQLVDILHVQKTEPLFVVLSCSKNVAADRLTRRGRADDTFEAVGNRLATFDDETQPVIDWLLHRHSGLTIEIDAERPLEDVVRTTLNEIRYTL